MSGSGMTTPMLATHSNRRFSCKGIFRVSGRFFGAVFDPHDGSDGDGLMCRSHILPADKISLHRHALSAALYLFQVEMLPLSKVETPKVTVNSRPQP